MFRTPHRAAILFLVAGLAVIAPPANSTGALGHDCNEVVHASALQCEKWATISPGNKRNNPHVRASDDGRYFVVAYEVTTNGRAVAVHALDERGAILWETVYDGPHAHEVADIALAKDNGIIYVVGELGQPTNGGSLNLLAFETTAGQYLWAATLPAGASGRAMTISTDGTMLLVAGEYRHDFLIVSYDAKTGAEIWRATYDGDGANLGSPWYASYDVAFDIAMSTDGASAYVTGESVDDQGSFDGLTIALNVSDGTIRWINRWDGPPTLAGDAEAGTYEIAVNPHRDAMYVMGRAGLTAISNDGTTQWRAAEGFAECKREQQFLPGECVIEVAPDGRQGYVATRDDVFAFDAHDGAILWWIPMQLDFTVAKTGSRGSSDIVQALNGDVLVYVSGGSVMTTTPWRAGYETLALDAATGIVLSKMSYHRDIDEVSDVAAAPDGRSIAVTGDSYSAGFTSTLTVGYDLSNLYILNPRQG